MQGIEKLLPSDPDPDEKKIMRRDNERQRRQLMAILNATLRSLLPLELIKGKRSISEHIEGAVSYINQLKENIEEMNAKREEVRRIYGHSGSTTTQDFSCKTHDSNIMVGPTCWGGVEIVVSASCELERISLSRVLKALIAEGLNIVVCSSTTVNQRMFHTIQCEVDDLACMDLSVLQLKLNFLCISG